MKISLLTLFIAINVMAYSQGTIVASYSFESPTIGAGTFFDNNTNTADATASAKDLNNQSNTSVTVQTVTGPTGAGDGVRVMQDSDNAVTQLRTPGTFSETNISATDSVGIAFWARWGSNTVAGNLPIVTLLDPSFTAILTIQQRTNNTQIRAIGALVDNNDFSFFDGSATGLNYLDANWHHFAVNVYNAGGTTVNVDVYYDGSLSKSSTGLPGEDASGGMTSNIGRIVLGTTSTGNDISFDEVRVLSRALTTSEITALASSNPNLLNTNDGIDSKGFVSIYPNPSSSEVSLDDAFIGSNYIVSSLNGESMLSNVYEGGSIDITSLNSGMYILTVQTNNGLKQGKLIVE